MPYLKLILTSLIVFFVIVFCPLDISAISTIESDCATEEKEIKLDCYDEYREMLEAIPEDISNLLPKELYSNSAESLEKGAKKITSFDFILKSVLNIIGIELSENLGLITSLIGIVIFSSVMNTVKSSFSSSSIGEIFSSCTSCAAFVIGCFYQYKVIVSVKNFFKIISLLVNSMIPLMGAMYAMGGNVSKAVVNHGALMLFLNILDNFCSKSAIYISGICLAFASVGAIIPNINLGGISRAFKKIYTTILAFVMSVFSTVMATQSLIANKTDSLASKGMKFAVSNLIPVVGSAIAGTMGTISAGIEYLRASVGTIGIILVLLLLLPVTINLILTKFSLSSVSCIAEIMECNREKRLMDELIIINGLLLGCVCICSVCLIFMLVLFVKCTSNIGVGL